MDFRKLKKIFYKIKIILNCKWYFSNPKKNKYLFFDYNNHEMLSKYLKIKKFTILSTRYEKFNLFFLLKVLLSFKFKNIYINYQIALIKFINPKYIITLTDNNIIFYQIKKIFPSIKFICIQNSTRFCLGDFCDSHDKIRKFKIKKRSVDLFFVQDKISYLFLSKFFNSKFIILGSFKNNTVQIKKGKKIPNILFISQWRDHKKIIVQDKEYPFKIFAKSEIDLLKILIKYCYQNNILLDIKLTSRDVKEINFYKTILEKSKVKFRFLNFSLNLRKNYSLLDYYNLVVTCDSTLGFECIMRRIKTIFYSTRYCYLKISKKTLPNHLSNLIKMKKDEKSFYLDTLVSNKVLYNFIDLNYESSYTMWYKKNYRIIKNFLFFDYENKKIKKILKIK